MADDNLPQVLIHATNDRTSLISNESRHENDRPQIMASVESHNYLLRRHFDQATQTMDIFLYEVTNQNHIRRLALIKPSVLQSLVVNN